MSCEWVNKPLRETTGSSLIQFNMFLRDNVIQNNPQLLYNIALPCVVCIISGHIIQSGQILSGWLFLQNHSQEMSSDEFRSSFFFFFACAESVSSRLAS